MIDLSFNTSSVEEYLVKRDVESTDYFLKIMEMMLGKISLGVAQWRSSMIERVHVRAAKDSGTDTGDEVVEGFAE